eukprot:1292205-Rhodomonas_salina.1
MTYPKNQPMPHVDVGFGQCESCDDLFGFSSVEISPSANQSTWSGVATDGKPVLVGKRTLHEACSDGAACARVLFSLEWAAPTLRPYFFVVKATSCSDRTTFAAAPIPFLATSRPQAGVVHLRTTPYRSHYASDGKIPVA